MLRVSPGGVNDHLLADLEHDESHLLRWHEMASDVGKTVLSPLDAVKARLGFADEFGKLLIAKVTTQDSDEQIKL